MTRILSSADIREIESAFASSSTSAFASKSSLMQLAGRAVANAATALLKSSKTKRVLVLAGPGNNGGDAWVAAQWLQKQKMKVSVLSLGAPSASRDPAAQRAAKAFVVAKGAVVKSWPKDAPIDLVIDGLFGIGLARSPSGAFADAINAANAGRAAQQFSILSIDVPSGLDADTGVAFNPCIEADATLSFIAGKPGLFTGDGVDVAGNVSIDALGTDSIRPAAASDAMALLTRDAMAALIPTRRRSAHKGHLGDVGIVGGATGMTGAAVLAARAALHMGPGKVYLGLFDNARPAFDTLHPEIMLRDARALAKDSSIDAFAVGMGAGELSASSLLGVLTLEKPTVVDADALNAIPANPSLGAAFRAKRAESAHPCLPFVFTPHPGEAARLLGISVADVNSNRIQSARRIAREWGVVTVLKGAGSIVAHPDGRAHINTTGNPGMASGGMGDALAGMIVAFLAQGMVVWDAARLAVYLHGAAADSACHHGMGPRGLTASEVIFEARTLLNSGLDDHHDD
jgi:ADP-dependent NAD(P)H-hydrate dehydratase / NAD(P)H-hydrate epimerase